MVMDPVNHFSNVWLSADEVLNTMRPAILMWGMTELVVAGAISTAMYPLLFVPLGRLLMGAKRSINAHHTGGETFSDFRMQAVKIFTFWTFWMGFAVRSMAAAPNVQWSMREATLVNTIVFFFLASFLQDLISYFVHRLMHTRLMWRVGDHAYHHRESTPSSYYDSLYVSVFETFIYSLIACAPVRMLPCHVLSAPVYLYANAFFGHVANHSGREFRIAPTIPFVGRVVIYDTQHHDDHHRYRHGNYANLFPCIDVFFGTKITVRVREPLPAQVLWRKAASRYSLLSSAIRILMAPNKGSWLLQRSRASDISERISYLLEDAAIDIDHGSCAHRKGE